MELDIEKKNDERIEARIRQLRKERNKARLQPSREQGPASKRRKLEENEYINVTELWGEPPVTEQKKTVRIDEQEVGSNSKKTRISSPTRVQEHVMSTPEEQEVECEDWNKKFVKYREEILREQERKDERLKLKGKKE